MDLDPKPQQNRFLRKHILYGLKRGPEFARRLCVAMSHQVAAMIRKNQTLSQTQSHEIPIRNQQTIQPAHTNVLAP